MDIEYRYYIFDAIDKYDKQNRNHISSLFEIFFKNAQFTNAIKKY